MKFLVFCVFFVILNTARCLPRLEERMFGSLNSTNNLGSFGSSNSNATASGIGSAVNISGIVTGDTSSNLGVTYSNPDHSTSSIASQGNCSDFSTGSATGSEGADAFVAGNCTLNLNENGSHHQRVVFGMESQVNNQPQPAGNQVHQSNNEAVINQTTSQNHAEGYAEAYQMVSGPQATSSFSGVMASAGDQIVAGPSETIMSHTITGQTNVETVLAPFSSIDQLPTSIN